MLSASGRGRPKTKGPQYVPSYMDSGGSVEPCVVCGDAATGYHYRCMTCEGCKGFFRRTIQKQLKYVCKGDDDCVVDKTTRNACQQCRFRKCVSVGMAIDLVLNDTQRIAKRQLIEDNRDRRKVEAIRAQLKAEQTVDHMTTQETELVHSITSVYYSTVEINGGHSVVIAKREHSDRQPPENPDPLTESIKKIIDFANQIPYFLKMDHTEQQILLRGGWIELTLLKVVRRYDADSQLLTLPSGRVVTSSCLIEDDDMHWTSSTGSSDSDPSKESICVMTKLIFQLASSVGRLEPDDVETAMMASLLLFYPDRSGLDKSTSVECAQDEMLSALKHYVSDTFPGESIRWPKLLMKLTDIRATGARLYDYLSKKENMTYLSELFGDSQVQQ